MEYDSIYEQIAKGAVIRSKATWYEKGEKSNKFLFEISKHIRKLRVLPKTILKIMEF